VKVKGETYNGNMPPWEGSLTDKKIAAVASYIRNEWGNSAPEISEAKVKAARAEFASHAGQMTEPALLAIAADATLPDAGGGAASNGAGAAGSGTPPTTSAAAPAGGSTGAAATAPPPTAAAAPAAGPATEQLMAEGKKHYLAICVACHQPTGMGLPPAFPPLVGTDYVTGDPKRFAAIVLKGVAGPITVGSVTYNSVMPGQEMMLTDAKIAAILTYVRGSFGNSAPPVSPEVVANARKEFAGRATPWTEAELKAMEGGAGASATPKSAPAAQEESTPAPATPASDAAPAPAPTAAPTGNSAQPNAVEAPEQAAPEPPAPTAPQSEGTSATTIEPSSAPESPAPEASQNSSAASLPDASPSPSSDSPAAQPEAPAAAQ
jgi:mono/diheme cytochrome c family protein